MFSDLFTRRYFWPMAWGGKTCYGNYWGPKGALPEAGLIHDDFAGEFLEILLHSLMQKAQLIELETTGVALLGGAIRRCFRSRNGKRFPPVGVLGGGWWGAGGHM